MWTVCSGQQLEKLHTRVSLLVLGCRSLQSMPWHMISSTNERTPLSCRMPLTRTGLGG